MRTKRQITLVSFFMVFFVFSAIAEETTFETVSDHYRVVSEVSQSDADTTADRLEAFLTLYNQQFRLPVAELERPLQVRVFATRARFDDYLRRLIGETRQGFAYLHYGDPAKNELVGFHTTGEDLDASLIHQSFIQYFRTFIANPPLWIREGFAVYFEATRYDPEFGAAVFRENLAWLQTLKGIVTQDDALQPIPLDDMLALSLEEARRNVDVFYPQAWGMISFLINAPKPETNRILWDSISALSPSASLDENTRNVYNRAFRWIDQQSLQEDFVDYVIERRTFRGWVEHAVSAFNEGEIDEAERAFVQAGNLRDDHHVPYYFLGLINYERGNYSLADYYYQQALDRGAEESVTLYALGVNAYADNRFADARSYLEMTMERDPDYRERAENILMRIQG